MAGAVTPTQRIQPESEPGSKSHDASGCQVAALVVDGRARGMSLAPSGHRVQRRNLAWKAPVTLR